MSFPFFSAIISTCNRARLIERALACPWKAKGIGFEVTVDINNEIDSMLWFYGHTFGGSE